MLARVGSIGGAKAYPAEISIPDDIDRASLRLGMPGPATVFSNKAGVIGILMSPGADQLLHGLSVGTIEARRKALAMGGITSPSGHDAKNSK